MLDKIDKAILKLLTKIVIRWEKRHKQKLHKIDFFIMLTGWETVIWMCSIIIPQIYKHSVFSIVVSSVLATGIGIMEAFKFMDLKDQKVKYDQIWELRKHPEMYKAVKEWCDHNVNEDHHRRPRLTMLKFFAVALILLTAVHSIVSLVYISFAFNLYRDCIFDLDEPDKKEKKATEKLTDVLLKSWQSLIGTLNPVRG